MVLIMSHALHRDDITKRRCTVDFKVECLDCIARIGVSDFFWNAWYKFDSRFSFT